MCQIPRTEGQNLAVLLYRVGRNLNRAYRTCEAFGIQRLLLLDCREAHLRDNLFGATGRVDIETISMWPNSQGMLALETWYEEPLWSVNWQRVSLLVLGGETAGLPRSLRAEQKAAIPLRGNISGLTVEAALAIALWEYRRRV